MAFLPLRQQQSDSLRQQRCRVRFDWGLAGGLAMLDRPEPFVVVVDVLSFGTAVSVLADRGAEVYPFRWRDERAARFAESVDAVLASGRRQGEPSLSPASLRRVTGFNRLVLPSPNGSTLCAELAGGAAAVLAGCLRNARAVAGWLAAAVAAEPDRAVAVVAAGEQWPDGALRPAVEDLWGAGAILTGLLHAVDRACWSPEALAAVAAFRAVRPELAGQLADCASGRELFEGGFGADVEIAAELNSSTAVPVLVDGRFVPAG